MVIWKILKAIDIFYLVKSLRAHIFSYLTEKIENLQLNFDKSCFYFCPMKSHPSSIIFPFGEANQIARNNVFMSRVQQKMENLVDSKDMFHIGIQPKLNVRGTVHFALDIWKQPFADVPQSRCSQKFRKFHRKTAVLESLLNKASYLQACNFIKKKLLFSS